MTPTREIGRWIVASFLLSLSTGALLPLGTILLLKVWILAVLPAAVLCAAIGLYKTIFGEHVRRRFLLAAAAVAAGTLAIILVDFLLLAGQWLSM